MKWMLLVALSSAALFSSAQMPNAGWQNLFNGKDLKTWDSYMRPPNMMGYDNKQDTPMEPIGLNKDPYKVFTVENGMIHISGQIWGAITSRQEYSNFHIRFQTKWGEKQWPPRATGLRDAGFLFHCSEPFDYSFKCWMRSIEMQVQETEIGDHFNLGGGEAEFQLSPGKTGDHKNVDQYDGNAPLKRFTGRVYRSGDFESPKGEWTTSEVIARQADAVFIVNGFVVNRLFNIYRNDLKQQVTSGRIQFQSESAEYWLKNIQIRPISFKRTNAKLTSPQTDIIIGENEKQQIEITNTGEPIELVAAELIGKDIDKFVVRLPSLPMILKKGEKIILPVTIKPGSVSGNKVKLRLESELGPVPGWEANLTVK
jgi:hypothetical protein